MRLLAVPLLLLLAAVCGAATVDGPYVLRTPDGWQSVTVEKSAEGSLVKAAKAVKPGDRLTIDAVGEVPAWTLTLREPAAIAPDEVKGTAKSVFVVADTHGEYEILVAMLRAHEIVDAKLQWTFGQNHLVVLGDVLDRGPNHLEILWLLYELEARAAKAGGGVHLVLGNHETMVMRADLRYLNVKYQDTSRVLGRPYQELFAADSLMGQWLRSKPAVMRIGDSLCLHAGVSRALLDSEFTLSDINASVRETMIENTPGAGSELILGPLGPLWYRGYFEVQRDFPHATTADVEQTLKKFNVRRILVGHTRVPAITALYGGSVIAVHVYPQRVDGRTEFESLLIREGETWRATPDGKLQRLR